MVAVGKRVLVTGAAGFIGRHLVHTLVGRGAVVAGLDRRPWPDAPCPMLRLDIRDRPAVDEAFAAHGPDTVVHLAALVGVRPSLDAATRYAETNVAGTLNVRDAAARAGARHLVFASSSSVYGSDSAEPSHEDDRLSPRSPYAETKISGEALARAFDGQVTVARLFTVYGLGMRRDLAVRHFSVKIGTGQAISIFGDGHSRRDYTHVDDVVAGLVSALERGGPSSLTCNLGSGRSIALNDVVSGIEVALGRRARVVRVEAHPADALHTCADISRAALHLDYRPAAKFEESLRELAPQLVLAESDAIHQVKHPVVTRV